MTGAKVASRVGRVLRAAGFAPQPAPPYRAIRSGWKFDLDDNQLVVRALVPDLVAERHPGLQARLLDAYVDTLREAGYTVTPAGYGDRIRVEPKQVG